MLALSSFQILSDHIPPRLHRSVTKLATITRLAINYESFSPYHTNTLLPQTYLGYIIRNGG
jgi:hypothetical protein